MLFASAIVDYDYIMGLISRYTHSKPEKQKMNRYELIGLIASYSNFVDEREEIKEYIDTLKAGEALNEKDRPRGL